MVKVYDQIEEFEGAASVFQTAAWLRASWTHLLNDGKNRLWIAKWTEEKSDAFVLFPGYIDGKGCLRFINDTHSDMGGCVVTPGANVHYAFKEIAEAIKEDKRIKSVWLQKIPSGDIALGALGIFLRGAIVYRDNAYSFVGCHQIGDFISGQRHLKSKDKVRFKGFAKKCLDYNFELRCVKDGAVFPQEEIVELRLEMLKERRDDCSFFTDKMIDFIREIYQQGSCEIPMLIKGGKVLALDFRLLHGYESLAWVILSRSPEFVTQLYIRYAIEKNKQKSFVMNFGVGAYGWKLLTFRPEVVPTFALRYHKSFLGKFSDLIMANLRFAKDIIKSRRG